MKELKFKSSLYQLLYFWYFIILAGSSLAISWWCVRFVKSANNWDLILFEVGIGSSIGIIVSTILNGLFAIWNGIEMYWQSMRAIDSSGNIWMSIIYGLATLPAFYFWSGAYISLTYGGFVGAIAGIACAIVSVLL